MAEGWYSRLMLASVSVYSKGEEEFENDVLIEGGRRGQMTNGTEYKEVRQYTSDHHLVRFYFITRIYSEYVRSILKEFENGLKPDVVLINSCVWDVSRYSSLSSVPSLRVSSMYLTWQFHTGF